MPLRPIVRIGDPVLRRIAPAVEFSTISKSELSELIADLVDTMRDAPGAGLAAPQIGVSLRIVVLEIKVPTAVQLRNSGQNAEHIWGEELQLLAMINPKIVNESQQREVFFEYCLSANAYAGLLSRLSWVEVEYCDIDGVAHRKTFKGWPARVVQHEIDHLDGWICLDKSIPRSLVTVESMRESWAKRNVTEEKWPRKSEQRYKWKLWA